MNFKLNFFFQLKETKGFCFFKVDEKNNVGQCPACSFVFCTKCDKLYHGVSRCHGEEEEEEKKKEGREGQAMADGEQSKGIFVGSFN